MHSTNAARACTPFCAGLPVAQMHNTRRRRGALGGMHVLHNALAVPARSRPRRPAAQPPNYPHLPSLTCPGPPHRRLVGASQLPKKPYPRTFPSINHSYVAFLFTRQLGILGLGLSNAPRCTRPASRAVLHRVRCSCRAAAGRCGTTAPRACRRRRWPSRARTGSGPAGRQGRSSAGG